MSFPRHMEDVAGGRAGATRSDFSHGWVLYSWGDLSIVPRFQCPGPWLDTFHAAGTVQRVPARETQIFGFGAPPLSCPPPPSNKHSIFGPASQQCQAKATASQIISHFTVAVLWSTALQRDATGHSRPLPLSLEECLVGSSSQTNHGRHAARARNKICSGACVLGRRRQKDRRPS